VQVAEKKLQLATIPASFTGFSTNLLIKDGYGRAYSAHEVTRRRDVEQIFWKK